MRTLLRSQFSSGFDFKNYLGDAKGFYAGYSLDKNVRKNASSGGIVSSLLIYLLKTKQIQGALVSRLIVKKGEITPQTKIVTNPNEILKFASSFYVDIPILEKLNDIRKFKGKLAIVGLPCHIRTLKKLCEKDKNLSSKIQFTIGLFCGGNCKKVLLQKVLKKKRIEEKDINKITVKRGHIKGKINILLKNGEVVSMPFQKFNIYRMLWFYPKELCVHCYDHTSELADVSVGDIFIKEFKNQPIKHSSIICRNDRSKELLNKMSSEKFIELKKISKETVFRSQKKGLIFHKNIASRAKIGKLFGYKIKVPENFQIRWNDCIASFIVFLNITLSKNKYFQKILFKIPEPLLYVYIAVLKYLSYI